MRLRAIPLAAALLAAAAPILPAAAQLAPARLTIAPAHPTPGAFVRLTLRRAPGDTAPVVGAIAGEPLHFHPGQTPGTLEAIAGVSLELSDSLVAWAVETTPDGGADTVWLRVPVPHQRIDPTTGSCCARTRRASRLRVDRRFSQRPDSALTARIADENARARSIGRDAHRTPRLWSVPFELPRTARITSSFGSGRVFNGRVPSSHGGVDLAGGRGDPVRAANRGVVALVDTFFLAGRVIYLDHGDGVVTGYFHLSEADVAIGDTVERGQVIGKVGATGRVTGPHLHWSARYGALTVDPLDLVALTGGRVATVPRRKATPAKRRAATRRRKGGRR